MRQGVGSTLSGGTARKNPEVWVQLGEANQNIDVVLLETVQNLWAEMQILQADNERLCLEQEKIMKILLDRQNQRNPNPN